jgi:hypothetical protein
MMSFDDYIRQTAASQYGLVGRHQLRSFGATRTQIAHRIKTGALAALTPGVLELVGTPPSEGKIAMAALLDGPPGAVLSHTSAAAWWDLPGFHFHDGLHITVPHQGAPRRGRISMTHYHKDLPQDQLTTLRGIRVTSPALTIFHLAAILSAQRTARACDNAWSMRLLDGLDLHHLLKILSASGRNGIGAMRQILEERPPDYVPPESGLEARYRQLVVQDGMPEPVRQVNIFGPRWIGRADCRFPDVGLIVELLSVRFHASLTEATADQNRFVAFREAGQHVIAFWDFEVWNNPGLVLRKTRFAREILKAGGSLDPDDYFSRINRGL